MPPLHPQRSFPQALRLGAALSCLALLSAAACTAVDPAPPSEGLAVHLQALAACGEANPKSPFSDIGSMEIVVHDDTGKQLMRSKQQFKGAKQLSFPEVPAGPGRTITLLGYGHGGSTPTWFARKRGIKVVKNTTTTLDVAMMKLGGYTCVEKSGGAVPNVAFANATQIDNGRVLVTGGYAVAQKGGKAYTLTSPRDDAYIFNPNTGELRDALGKERMNAARAGHEAIYLPKRSEVLIVGGAQQMEVPLDGSGPPSWKVTTGVNVNFEMFDLAKDDAGNAVEKFRMPSTTEHVDKLVLPNLMPLADDFVVALGGAEWPSKDATNQFSYKQSDLFDPQEGDYGSFIKVAGALPLNDVRAGAALAFIDTTSDGGSRYLIWGGQANTVKAEIFREDSSPGSGIFDATYAVEGAMTKKKGSLFFATLTPLGADSEGRWTFLSVGGVRHDGKAWLPPDESDVYLLTLHDEEGKKKRIDTTEIKGLGAGVFMHKASLTDDKHVLISGGFSSYDKATTFTLRIYDIEKKAFVEPPAAASFVKRGAHAAVRLNNDCVLMWGGVASWADLEKTTAVASDIYCPSHLAQ